MNGSYFALSHHVDFLSDPDKGIRLHNYPEEWRLWFDEQGLGQCDPVHRASQRTSAGFAWRDISKLVPIGAREARIFDHAERNGIGDGLTVPAHVPGEAHGSVSFAARSGTTMAPESLAFAQMFGSFAFEAARLLGSAQDDPKPRLTDRQRECLLWVARGKTDWEIARILGVRHVTVIEHLRNARERYKAPTRVTLTVRALFDGVISFGDLARR